MAAMAACCVLAVACQKTEVSGRVPPRESANASNSPELDALMSALMRAFDEDEAQRASSELGRAIAERRVAWPDAMRAMADRYTPIAVAASSGVSESLPTDAEFPAFAAALFDAPQVAFQLDPHLVAAPAIRRLEDAERALLSGGEESRWAAMCVAIACAGTDVSAMERSATLAAILDSAPPSSVAELGYALAFHPLNAQWLFSPAGAPTAVGEPERLEQCQTRAAEVALGLSPEYGGGPPETVSAVLVAWAAIRGTPELRSRAIELAVRMPQSRRESTTRIAGSLAAGDAALSVRASEFAAQVVSPARREAAHRNDCAANLTTVWRIAAQIATARGAAVSMNDIRRVLLDCWTIRCPAGGPVGLDVLRDLARVGERSGYAIRSHPIRASEAPQQWRVCCRQGDDGRTPQHPGGLNVLFVDGRVEFVEYADRPGPVDRRAWVGVEGPDDGGAGMVHVWEASRNR